MCEAKEELKSEIEKIADEATIEKVRAFIMGILAQQNLEHHDAQERGSN